MPPSAPTTTKPIRGRQRTTRTTRTTRQDWINIALDTLISEGVENIKVLLLAEKLNCARSSFYWYFKNRDDLLECLLDHWQATNTSAIVSKSVLPADSINHALVHVFTCWVDPNLFDSRLDFAIRDWARRSGSVRRALDISDAARLDALAAMFERFDFASAEAAIRARIVYFTQIGYHALDIRETIEQRMQQGQEYLYCMTGQHPTNAEIESLNRTALTSGNII